MLRKTDMVYLPTNFGMYNCYILFILTVHQYVIGTTFFVCIFVKYISLTYIACQKTQPEIIFIIWTWRILM